ncbi:hypothetical protein LSCM1_06928 [Leishmania martiniquensis]|uniref:Uncharacterized protein n=1 Tax=Leishmania martiniquensis TaxID=1580590 RepID=A0A836GJ04_9TRYP|nr:hypothetical protein LSCM1_06928 [Leishmania martiniquensis]
MASPASSSPLSSEKAAIAQEESLEEAYVRLHTQLLLHLQRRNTGAALRTAEVIREVLLRSSSSSSTAHGSVGAGGCAGVAATPSGADLFHGSPAEQLLQMRGRLQTLALAESASLCGDHDLDKTDKSQSTPSGTGSGSSTIEASSDGDDGSLESDERGLDGNYEVDDDGVDKEEVAKAGGNSSSHARGHSQQQQQSAAYLLVEALNAWPKAPIKAGRASLSGASSAVSDAAAATPSSVMAPAKKRVSRFGAFQRCLQPPGRELRGRSKVDTDAEEMGKDSMAPSGNPSAPSPGEKAASVVDGESLDSDAEATWMRIRAQVAKEMNRLSIVRKHR